MREDPGGVSRREFIERVGAGLVALSLPGCANGPGKAASGKLPPADAWQALSRRVGGRLLVPTSPIAACHADPASAASQRRLALMGNPFFLEEDPGATQSTGWAGAWQTAPSAYAVAAGSPADVAAAVDFAREHGLRLVVKGTGHDYLGRSCAPDSLLVWTHPMRRVVSHEAFVPEGAPDGTAGVPAVSVQAGARWLEAFREVTVKGGRYVQGGGCASVGACGGFVLGGGFGSWSKKFGPGAGGLLEAEVVTADGKVRIANAHRHDDLFWALRGGGGGTFGIVTRMTLATHELPARFGLVRGKIVARSDAAFRALIERMLRFYREQLHDEHWGEQFALEPDNTIELFLMFQGLDRAQVDRVWAPLEQWLKARPDQYTIERSTILIPARQMWDYRWWAEHHPELVTRDSRPGQAPDQYWWTPNSGEVSMYWYTYQSRWIPTALFEAGARGRFAGTLFEASRRWPVVFHVNKALGGASKEAIARGRQTAINPVVFDSAALVIMAAGKRGKFPGLAGHEPDAAEATQRVARIDAAMKLIREATPDSGAYANEADYFERDWQRAFWGDNYPRLLKVKRKYDPGNLFRTHHSVGSEL